MSERHTSQSGKPIAKLHEIVGSNLSNASDANRNTKLGVDMLTANRDGVHVQAQAVGEYVRMKTKKKKRRTRRSE